VTSYNSPIFGLFLNNCQYVTLDGGTIDTLVTAFAQGGNISINTQANTPSSGAITFTPDPNFTSPVTSYSVPGGLTAPIIYDGKILFFDGNGNLIPTLLDYPTNQCPITSNNNGTYTVIPRGNLTMYGNGASQATLINATPGARVVFTARQWGHAVFLDLCAGCAITNLNVFGSGQMGIGEQLGSATVAAGNTYTNCNVMARPNTTRLIASNADGFHSTAMPVGPTVEYCDIGNTGDDIMNIHGFISEVYATGSSGSVSILTQLSPADLSGGTTVRFYSLPYLKPLVAPGASTEDFTLTSTPTAITDSTNSTFINANNSLPSNGLGFLFADFLGYPQSPVIQFSVNNDVSPAGANVVQGDVAMKRSRIGAGSVVQSNYFHDCFARGVIMNSENGTISNNYISNIGTCSIRVSPDVIALEGPFSRNLTISNNTILANGGSSLTAVASTNSLIGAITITADVRTGTRAAPQSAEHQNITVTGNTITNAAACAIFMSDVTTGTISNNIISNPYFYGAIPASGSTTLQGVGYKVLNFTPPPNYAIVTADSQSLTIQNNTVTNLPTGVGAIPATPYGWYSP